MSDNEMRHFEWQKMKIEKLEGDLTFYKKQVDVASLGDKIDCNVCVLNVYGVCGLLKHHLHPLDKRNCFDCIKPTKKKDACHHINVEHLTNPSLIGHCDYTHICTDCGTLLKLQPYTK